MGLANRIRQAVDGLTGGDDAEPEDGEYRCLRCGEEFERDVHSCSRCGGQFIGPTEERGERPGSE